MKIDSWYTFTDGDWQTLEFQFKESYIPVAQFVLENKGTLSEARDIFVEAFRYYTVSVELKGSGYMDKYQTLIYSFSRILWLKKLAKRNVDFNLIRHRQEFFELDDTFHEIDLMTERSGEVSQRLAEIGEPCRTLVLEIVGRDEDPGLVGGRFGLFSKERTMQRLSSCLKKLTEKTEKKSFDDSLELFNSCLQYILDSKNSEKPTEQGSEVCLAILSRTTATIKNHVAAGKRNETLRDFKERLLPSDNVVLEEIESKPKTRAMKTKSVVLLVSVLTLLISSVTTVLINSVTFYAPEESTISTVNQDTIAVDTTAVVQEIEWIEQSGVIITNDGYALTSAEHLRINDLIETKNHDSQSGYAKVVSVDYDLGIALLKIDSVLYTNVPFRLSQNKAQVGEELVSMGYKDDYLLYEQVSPGMASEDFIHISGKEVAKGAPLLSRYGELKGIVTRSNGVSSSIQTQKILEFLESNSPEKLKVPSKNRLYYSTTEQKVERLKPCILKFKFQV